MQGALFDFLGAAQERRGIFCCNSAALAALLLLVGVCGLAQGVRGGVLLPLTGSPLNQRLLLSELFEVLMKEEEAELLRLDITVFVVIYVDAFSWALAGSNLHVPMLEVLEGKPRGDLVDGRILHGRAMTSKRGWAGLEKLRQVANVDLQLTVCVELPELNLFILS